jgi:Uma2 family endonuclease
VTTIDRPAARPQTGEDWLDAEGVPWLENGERMTQAEFHERYRRMPEGFKAELIEGVVYVIASPLSLSHARNDFSMVGWLFVYSAATPGTVGQINATTILGDQSEPQPDSALLIRPESGGQTRDGDDQFTHGAPELIVEVAWSSRSIDLHAKFRDYERAGVLEYIVRDLRDQRVHWFVLRDGRFEPLAADADSLFRSQVFPGLWLDPSALASGDPTVISAMLQRGLASPEHQAFVADLERRRAERAARP